MESESTVTTAPESTVTAGPEPTSFTHRAAIIARGFFIWLAVGGVGYTWIYFVARAVEDVQEMPSYILTAGLAMVLAATLGLLLLDVSGFGGSTRGGSSITDATRHDTERDHTSPPHSVNEGGVNSLGRASNWFFGRDKSGTETAATTERSGSGVRKSLIAWFGIGFGQIMNEFFVYGREDMWDVPFSFNLALGLGTVAFAVVGLVVWELLTLGERRAQAYR